MNDEQNNVYPLTTLRDIFNLPTIEQMEVCLDELKQSMLQARATNDLICAIANKNGTKIDKAIEWPEVLDWIDDGKGEIGLEVRDTDGNKLFSIETK